MAGNSAFELPAILLYLLDFSLNTIIESVLVVLL